MARISDTDLILNANGSVFHLGLLPEQLADTILAVGDPGRVEQVSRNFDSIEFKNQKREFVTHTGTFRGKRISVISTGIGPDNVEIFFHEVDALVNIDLQRKEAKAVHRSLNIIRVGTSGAMQKEIEVGSLVVSDQAVGLDNLMQFYTLPQSEAQRTVALDLQRHTGISFLPYVAQGSDLLREKIGKGIIKGNTATCPGFYAPQGRQVRVPIRYPNLLGDLGTFRSADFHLSNFEMETSTYFSLGRLMGHETASANAIIANRVTGEFSKNAHNVVDSLIQHVLEHI
jgi:uridine phosphorylase